VQGRAEAREHPRAPAKIRVDYQYGNVTGVGHTHDISQGGIFLTCQRVAPAGTRVYLRLHLPGSRGGEPLKIIGLVTRSVAPEANPSAAGMGVHFEVAYARTRDSLGDFVDDLLVNLAQSGTAEQRRPEIRAVDGSTDANPEYALRFPSVNAPASPPLDAAQVKQAFAFAAEKQAAGPDLKRISALIAKLVLLVLLLGLGYFFVTSVAGLFGGR
jgi:uncharacterized protein (TIGR02266 family)